MLVSCQGTIEIKSLDKDSTKADSASIGTINISPSEEQGIEKEPSIRIISPVDGAITNSSDIRVVLDISNFKLVAPERFPKTSQGHIRLLFDDIEFTSAKPEFVIKSESDGQHTIKAQFMMSNNTVLPYSDTIKIYVNSGLQKPVPSLKITYPKKGGLVIGAKVLVEVQAENFKIVPVGQPVKDGEGHFHVWLGSEKKVSHQNNFTFDDVVSGKYLATAELVKSDHTSLSPRVTDSITINVESDYVPKTGIKQEGVKEYTVEADDYDFYPNRLKAKINETVRISFKFRDSSIYYAGLDIRGPFDDIIYKLRGTQPVTREFIMSDETRISSYWPSSGVKKADLIVEIEK